MTNKCGITLVTALNDGVEKGAFDASKSFPFISYREYTNKSSPPKGVFSTPNLSSHYTAQLCRNDVIIFTIGSRPDNKFRQAIKCRNLTHFHYPTITQKTASEIKNILKHFIATRIWITGSTEKSYEKPVYDLTLDVLSSHIQWLKTAKLTTVSSILYSRPYNTDDADSDDIVEET